MGIGKKNGNTTTSASSEDSSGAPSEMAVDLSSSALEAAAQFSGVSSNGTESWERSGVSDAGKSSGDDVPSSQVDTNRQNDQVSEEHTPEGHDDPMDRDDPVEGHDDRTGRDEIYSALEEVNKEPIQPQTPAVSVPDGADTAAAAADEDAEDAATVDMEGDAGMEALEVEGEAETEEEAEAEEEAGPEPEPEPEPEAHVEEPAEEPAEEAPKKKRRRGGLHAVAASTTDTPPPTMLHAKQRKKKTVEEGSGESGAPEPEPESAVAEEDSEEAPVEKKKKKNRKKRLAMETESEGDKGETASSGKEKKSKKRSEAGADADGGARAKEKAPKEPKEPKEKGPKKARSSYIFFSIDQRKDTDISSLGFQEAGKAISENWKAISAEDRSRYDEMAKQDKQRFQREQKAWEAEHGAPEPRAKPKKDKGSKAKASTSSASSSSGKAAKPKAKKGKATKPADDSSEDDEPTTDAPRVSPMPPLELDTLIPRTRYPMRTESIAVGDKIVWVPQAFDTFVSTYDAMLQQLSLSELPDDVSTNLMQLPADGTANGAEVLSITEPETFAPGLKDQLRGWLLLRLKRLTLPGEEPSDDMEYNLPMISRAECDVDQHVCDLKQYEASKKWCVGIGSNSQVAVRFAVDSKEEEEWEGRIWDEQPWEPKQYPNSTYKRLRLLWYVKSQADDGGLDGSGGNWIMDNDQTDTEVSPWEARPSESHARWVKKNQELAKFSGPLRLDRRTLCKLVPQPDSEQLCPSAIQEAGAPEPAQELVKRVLKKICSIEATAPLWHPVDQSEKAYHSYVSNPISLSEIHDKHEAGEYVGKTAWGEFDADVRRLYDNAMDFNDDDTLWFTLGAMVQQEMQDAVEQIAEHWPEVLQA